MRLNDAGWKEYLLITWPDEPSWDCKWVSAGYEIRNRDERGATVTAIVVYKPLGLILL